MTRAVYIIDSLCGLVVRASNLYWGSIPSTGRGDVWDFFSVMPALSGGFVINVNLRLVCDAELFLPLVL